MNWLKHALGIKDYSPKPGKVPRYSNVSEPVLMMVKAIRERPKTIHFSSDDWHPLWAHQNRITVHSTIRFKISDTVTREEWEMVATIGLNGIYATSLGEFLLATRTIFGTPQWMTIDETGLLIDTFHEVYGDRAVRLRKAKERKAMRRQQNERSRLCKVYRNA